MDHDIAGIEASEKFHDLLIDTEIKYERLLPKYKDWNEELKANNNLPAITAEEHLKYSM